jgi:biotin carboxyl carrier protein
MAKKFEGLVDFPILSMKYRTRLTKKYMNRKEYEAPDIKKVKSYIPGTIIKVYAKKGKKMKKGATLLILEAMKMRNKILMPIDGKIKAVHVKEGEMIPKEFLMVEIE